MTVSLPLQPACLVVDRSYVVEQLLPSHALLLLAHSSGCPLSSASTSCRHSVSQARFQRSPLHWPTAVPVEERRPVGSVACECSKSTAWLLLLRVNP